MRKYVKQNFLTLYQTVSDSIITNQVEEEDGGGGSCSLDYCVVSVFLFFFDSIIFACCLVELCIMLA